MRIDQSDEIPSTYVQARFSSTAGVLPESAKGSWIGAWSEVLVEQMPTWNIRQNGNPYRDVILSMLTRFLIISTNPVRAMG